MSVYMLDTDICSYIVKDRPVGMKDVFLKHRDDSLCLSAVTYAELLYGLEKKPSDKLKRDIDEFVTLVQIVAWDHIAARKYAKIRHQLTAQGKIISELDMQIAAAALAIDAQLVTNNKKHFDLIPSLAITDWLHGVGDDLAASPSRPVKRPSLQ